MSDMYQAEHSGTSSYPHVYEFCKTHCFANKHERNSLMLVFALRAYIFWKYVFMHVEYIALWGILRPGIAIRLNFAASSIIRV